MTNIQNTRGGNIVGIVRGFRRRRGCKYVIIFIKCGVEGHKDLECLENRNYRKINEFETHVMQTYQVLVVVENFSMIHHKKW